MTTFRSLGMVVLEPMGTTARDAGAWPLRTIFFNTDTGRWEMQLAANTWVAVALIDGNPNQGDLLTWNALLQAVQPTSSITDGLHGSRGSGLHGDSHAESHAASSALHTGTLEDTQFEGSAADAAHTVNTSLWNSQVGTARKVLAYDSVTGKPKWEYLTAIDVLEPAQVTGFTVQPAAAGYPDDTPSTAMVASSGTDTPRFALSYQGTPTAATIDILSHTYGGGRSPEVAGPDYPATVVTPFTSLDSPAINRGQAVAEAVTFRASATVDGQSKTRDVTLTYVNERMWGISTNAAIDTSGEIDTFRTAQNKELSNSRAKTFTVTAGAGEYIYYILRSALGTPTFVIGGFEGGFSKVGSAVSWANPRGFTETIDVWRSDNANLGATTVTVS